MLHVLSGFEERPKATTTGITKRVKGTDAEVTGLRNQQPSARSCAVLALVDHVNVFQIPSTPDKTGARSNEIKQTEKRQGEVIRDASLASAAKAIKVPSGYSIFSVVFTADGGDVLAGGDETMIRCWRAEDGKEVGVPMDAGRGVRNIAVSQDGKWVVSGTDEGIVRVFDAQSGGIVAELKGQRRKVWAVDVSLDRTKVATGSTDNARIWSRSDGEQLEVYKPKTLLNHGYSASAVKFSPNGLLLATATWSVAINECESGRLLVNFKILVSSSENQSIAWHHNSKHLFVASFDGHIHHLDVSTGNTVSKWRIHRNYPWCIALASDSGYVAASGDTSVSFWDPVTHKQIGYPIEHTDSVVAMAISANHEMAAGAGNTISLWNLRDVLPVTTSKTARNLQADLTDLRRCYAAQSRRLATIRQIATLTTELAHLKDSASIKMYELAAVRRKLDQLPDVSRELLSVRHDLRTSKTRVEEIQQQHSFHSTAIISTVAARQPKLSDIQHFITVSDVHAEYAIIQTLDRLNSLVQLTSIFMARSLINNHHSSVAEEQSSAVRRASQYIAPSLVRYLATMSRDSVAMYLPVAFRAHIFSRLSYIISSWTVGRGHDKVLGGVYDRVQESGKLSYLTPLQVFC
ncbi:WD40-repeat-containing domain protein [Chiua virens]|nr:WD40-repeat-containing domain protein [Chiua virens]